MTAQNLASILLMILFDLQMLIKMRNSKFNFCVSNALRGHRRIEGRYANYFNIGFNAFEFVLDFGQHFAESDEAELYTRIITNPRSAKELLETLRVSIDEYEENLRSGRV